MKPQKTYSITHLDGDGETFLVRAETAGKAKFENFRHWNDAFNGTFQEYLTRLVSCVRIYDEGGQAKMRDRTDFIENLQMASVHLMILLRDIKYPLPKEQQELLEAADRCVARVAALQMKADLEGIMGEGME